VDFRHLPGPFHRIISLHFFVRNNFRQFFVVLYSAKTGPIHGAGLF
jgi:hypothetical protein